MKINCIYNSGSGLLLIKLNESQIKKLLKSRLNESRFYHSLCVAKECREFAQENGQDEEKCYIAGLLHDICKNDSDEILKEYVKNSKLDVSDIEIESKPLWHAVAGAEYIQKELGVTDKEIIYAVRCHTVGRKNMSMVEKIVMMADYVSEDRDYDGVKKLNKLAHKDLHKALLEAVEYTINDLMNKGLRVNLCTVECYNDLVCIVNK